MRKFLTLFLVIAGLGFSGCTEDSQSRSNPGIVYLEESGVSSVYTEYDVLRIDGCQYIQTTYRHDQLAHKGNCDNPIHVCPCD